MDNREILTRFKSGALDRQQVLALLSGAGTGTESAAAPARGTAPDRGAAPAPPSAAPERRPAPRTVPPPAARPADEGYAVVAVDCRFPGADGPAAFWEAGLRAPDGPGPVPQGRPGAEDGEGESAQGYFLDGVDAFDPAPFRIEAAEAASMDPQERLLLHCAWQALEGAGHAGARLDALTGADGEPRDVGVFTAVTSRDYARLADGRSGPAGYHLHTAARLSHVLDLHGPSQNVDTGASSFLTAVHQALGALRAGECAAALVAAAELRLHPGRHHDGGGEGVAVILLKPLAAARAAGDRVHAVLTASAVGHPGRGTSAALRDRLRHRVLDRTGEGPLVLEEDAAGAAARVGRAGAATGAAALLRAVLQLRHAVLLPGPARERPAPWEAGPGAGPRTALVGVHEDDAPHAVLVVREPPPATAVAPRDPEEDGGPQLVLLSAATPAHLAATAGRLADWLGSFEHAGRAAPGPGAVARELRLGRAVMDCRLAVVVDGTAQLAEALAGFADGVAGPGPSPVRSADLRDGTADPLLLTGLAETRGYVAALWRGRRYEQLTRLWLAGVDVLARDTAPGAAPVLDLPPGALLPARSWPAGDTASDAGGARGDG
ncbi:beta-ketoacyl synthase N-terminal-like domain-containing protein [Streptomyces sp. ITFR-16]|uniref:beta-ketoacyl synthase N-terminal-like domain-containing protein n=1 Tax=Streptomyces sp. ITFR-16 TaxID=3075198 RepID=UPI0028898906|nr:beta-ketoacyl synthase N-terminal-like domain-containing protein [Streptomyces sp. ITFR-16]WNI27241.1 beta-ketoacyl synthase N-terminal-like domain-containing protein [Streptomyces sp. ITFR-16]